jgi:hypothetical protein
VFFRMCCRDGFTQWKNEKMTNEYNLTGEQKNWAKRSRHGLSPAKLRQLVADQKGKCALPGIDLISDAV